MNKNVIKTKTIVVLLMLMAMLSPLTVCAQGLFSRGSVDDYYEGQNRSMMNKRGYGSGGYNLFNQQFGIDGYELYNQTFGQDVPLGNGLIIMVTAGFSYAFKKRKSGAKQ